MIYFISDLHLSSARPEVTQAFFRFLDTTAKEATALYILGDFFDAWIGDDDDTPEYQTIIQALREYQDKGTRLFFMHGNRDFLIGEDFAQRTGAELLSDPTVINLNQGPTLLMHGDSLCTRDTEYMNFRQMVRQPIWQAEVLKKPLDERKAIAAHLKATSQSMNSIKAEEIMDVTPEEVVKEMSKHNTQRLIHGHTHRPARHALSVNQQTAERIVLGDWHKNGWYLCADNNGIKLCSFPIEP